MDSNSDVQISNINNDQDEAESFLNTEQLKATVKEMVSDSVKVTAEGELKEVIGNWSVWIDGEFGEFTIGKQCLIQMFWMKDLFMSAFDKALSDDGDLFGFALEIEN